MRAPARLATISLVVACGAPDATAPRESPALLGVTLNKQSAAPGDTVQYSATFTAGDAPGDPVYLHTAFSGGSVTTSDTLAVPARHASLTGVIIVPSRRLAGTLRITIVVPKRSDSASASVTVTPRPPMRSVAMVLHSPSTPAVFTTSPFNRVVDFIAGATDTLVVSAVDSTGLAWIGWALGPPANLRDSTRVSGATATATFPLAIPGGPDESPAGLEVFARADDRTLTDTTFTIGGIANYVDHPVLTAPLTAAVQDMVYDAKRHIVYLSEQGQTRIMALSVPGMTYEAAIALPGQPMGIDLVPSGDTLVVALDNTQTLAFIDLASSAHTTTLVTLGALSPYTLLYPRVARDRRILLELGAHGGGVGDYDLPSGKTDLYFSGADGSVPLRSGDGSIIVLRDVGKCGLGEYSTALHEFSVYLSTCGERFPGQASASHDGSRLAIGVALFNGGLASLGSAQIPDLPLAFGVTDGAAVSNSGSDFYVVAPALCGGAACPQTAAGFYFRFSLSTDATPKLTLREIVNTPETPIQLLPIPGDQSLLGIGPTKLMLFDLTR